MEKQGSRALLAAVIGMGVLLFIGSLALVGVLVQPTLELSLQRALQLVQQRRQHGLDTKIS